MKCLATLSLIAIMAVGFLGCGSSSNSCDCAICINDVPAYPCDSEASCTEFAAAQGCSSSRLENSDDTCGDAPQPVCEVRDCTSTCQCPGVADADIANENL